MQIQKIPIVISRQGTPALWERVEGNKAVVVADERGERLRPMFTKGTAALLPLKPHCYVIEICHAEQKFASNIFRIVKIDHRAEIAVVEQISVAPEKLAAAIEFAELKVLDPAYTFVQDRCTVDTSIDKVYRLAERLDRIRDLLPDCPQLFVGADVFIWCGQQFASTEQSISALQRDIAFLEAEVATAKELCAAASLYFPKPCQSR